ncbi:hypothetical protein HK097_004098 [Rhizophlyctis rosea]|uniref:VWFA domain-containing protein n=1 Tax=Rhizophlyctis rosea TaxID=64517 RepID=A0AAD5S1P9_9FUNG|nr:hypothetical protein HK097_004098 [Rhizophlyctis rosea]
MTDRKSQDVPSASDDFVLIDEASTNEAGTSKSSTTSTAQSASAHDTKPLAVDNRIPDHEAAITHADDLPSEKVNNTYLRESIPADCSPAEHEMKVQRPEFVEGNQLDLAFALDCTGSMGSATESIKDIATKLAESQKADVNFALVSYRDHPPQDHSYVTNVYPFTSDLSTMTSYLAKQQAYGGGDGPEAVTAALHESLHLPWRPNATKVLIIIADAPPHGLGEHTDGFPNGDPDGRDPLKIVIQMRAYGICVFSVACEPSLSSYKHAVDFFEFVASATGGSLIPLTSASLLPDVIVGGAKEQMELKKMLEQFTMDAEKAKKSGAKTDDEVLAFVHQEWSKKGVQTHQTVVEDLYKPAAKEAGKYNVGCYFGSASLADATQKTKPVYDRLDWSKISSEVPSRFGHRAGASSVSPFGAPAGGSAATDSEFGKPAKGLTFGVPAKLGYEFGVPPGRFKPLFEGLPSPAPLFGSAAPSFDSVPATAPSGGLFGPGAGSMFGTSTGAAESHAGAALGSGVDTTPSASTGSSFTFGGLKIREEARFGSLEGSERTIAGTGFGRSSEFGTSATSSETSAGTGTSATFGASVRYGGSGSGTSTFMPSFGSTSGSTVLFGGLPTTVGSCFGTSASRAASGRTTDFGGTSGSTTLFGGAPAVGPSAFGTSAFEAPSGTSTGFGAVSTFGSPPFGAAAASGAMFSTAPTFGSSVTPHAAPSASKQQQVLLKTDTITLDQMKRIQVQAVNRTAMDMVNAQLE